MLYPKEAKLKSDKWLTAVAMLRRMELGFCVAPMPKMITIVLNDNGLRSFGIAIVDNWYMRKVYQTGKETLQGGKPQYVAA